MQDDSDNVPVSSENFELWIRMATDNKINLTNSWNFALIDYFHDFSVLREGDGVNFQKASATLDGCMKIYSHRIDSAAKDTGNLLSSLNIQSSNTSNPLDHLFNRRNRNGTGSHNNQDSESDENDSNEDSSDDENDDDIEEDDDNNQRENEQNETESNTQVSSKKNKSKRKKKNKKKTPRTKVKSFQSLKMKDSDRPVKTDPVFKNALANFDEGGAKSLLTNILRISKNSKIEFDVADDHDIIIDGDSDEERVNTKIKTDNNSLSDISIDISTLKPFIDFDVTNQDIDICPSLKELNSIFKGESDPVALLETLNNIEITQIKDAEMGGIDDIPGQINNEPADFDFDFDFDAGFDVHVDNYNDENNGDNEADVTSNASRRTQYSLFMEGENPDESDHNITFTKNHNEHIKEHYSSLNPFEANKPTKHFLEMLKLYDEIGKGVSDTHWKIARYKRNSSKTLADITKDQDDDGDYIKNKKSVLTRPKRRSRKTHEEIFIDFLSDSEDLNEEELFESAEYMSKTFLSEKERKLGRHLLEPDTEFTAKNLAYLSTKPNQLIKILFGNDHRPRKYHEKYLDNIPADEDYFAHVYDDREKNNMLKSFNDDDSNNHNNVLSDSILSEIDNDFDDDGGFDPVGAEGFDVPLADPLSSPPKLDGTLSQNNNKNNAIEYAKRAKKVDVKLLKQNIWNSIEEISVHKKKRSASHFEEDEEKVEQTTEKSIITDGEIENSKQLNTHDDISTEESTPGSDVSNMTNKTSSTTLDDAIDRNEAIDEMHFTNVVTLMASKYQGKAKNDLSTSFCFICLLHLANEQGLTLETQDNHEDIIIHK